MPFIYKPKSNLLNSLIVREFLANLVKDVVAYHLTIPETANLFGEIQFVIEGSTFNLADNLATKKTVVLLAIDWTDNNSIIYSDPSNNTGQYLQMAKLMIKSAFASDFMAKMDNLTLLLINSLCNNKSLYTKTVFGKDYSSSLDLNSLGKISNNTDYSTFLEREIPILFNINKV
jgi:hypothetical protein